MPSGLVMMVESSFGLFCPPDSHAQGALAQRPLGLLRLLLSCRSCFREAAVVQTRCVAHLRTCMLALQVGRNWFSALAQVRVKQGAELVSCFGAQVHLALTDNSGEMRVSWTTEGAGCAASLEHSVWKRACLGAPCTCG
jgi:hypothetical protein